MVDDDTCSVCTLESTDTVDTYIPEFFRIDFIPEIKPKYVIWSNGKDYQKDKSHEKSIEYCGMKTWRGNNGKRNKDNLMYEGKGIFIEGDGKNRKYIGIVEMNGNPNTLVKDGGAIIEKGNIDDDDEPPKNRRNPHKYRLTLTRESFNGIKSGTTISNIKMDNVPCKYKKACLITLNINIVGSIQSGINEIKN